MVKKYLKKGTSVVAAFAVVLSLSCCGVGDEILIDEIPTETTSETTEITIETAETTSEMTEEATTNESTDETTPEETEEVTTLTIPDEETILASLSDEEKGVWLSMPDIVTIRILNTYADELTEICYIEKNGGVKSFISDEYYNTRYGTIDQIKDKIDQNQNVEIVNVVDIHNLIEFYNTLMLIDSESKMTIKYLMVTPIMTETTYFYEIYGIKKHSENRNEVLQISRGHAKNPEIRDDSNGEMILDIYLNLEPFITIPSKGIGY